MLPLVSVVVVNWNRRELLRCCLRSLARQSYQDFEVLVVDNGSTDGSSALAEQAEFQGRHHWIRNAENHGFCAANNQAIRRARGTYIALLNNDAEADPGWLAALVGALAGALERNPRIGMAASKVLSFSNRGVIDKVGTSSIPMARIAAGAAASRTAASTTSQRRSRGPMDAQPSIASNYSMRLAASTKTSSPMAMTPSWVSAHASRAGAAFMFPRRASTTAWARRSAGTQSAVRF